MIPVPKKRTHTSSGAESTGRFKIKDSGWIKNILRDKIYSDKVMAILREYSCNAVDAHAEAGKEDVPIEVTLPTLADPVFKVRDYGIGLSEENVHNVFAEYGTSTKRESNEVVGFMGIGSKCGFAYSDQFVITSWHGGRKMVFSAALTGEDDVLEKLYDEESGEPSGVEITVPTKNEDREVFLTKATALFAFFDPVPVTNVPLGPSPLEGATKLPSGYVVPGSSTHHLVMGQVPYRIDPDMLPSRTAKLLRSMRAALAITAPLGGVCVSASREGLEYDKNTVATVVAGVDAIVEELVSSLGRFKKDEPVDWVDAIRIVRALSGVFRGGYSKNITAALLGGLPRAIREYGVKLPPGVWLKRVTRAQHGLYSRASGLGDFISLGYTPETARIYVHSAKDVAPGNFDFPAGENIVVLAPKRLGLEGASGLREVFAEAGLVGAPIADIGTIRRKRPRRANKKTAMRCVLRDKIYRQCTSSSEWEVIGGEPHEDDAYVILNRFQPDVSGMLVTRAARLYAALGKLLGVDAPPLIGYRDTVATPVDASKLPGTPYLEWGNKHLLPKLSKDLRTAAHLRASLQHMPRLYHADEEKFAHRVKELGPHHPLIVGEKRLRVVNSVRQNSGYRRNPNKVEDLLDLYPGILVDRPRLKRERTRRDKLRNAYPLLEPRLIPESVEEIEYVKALDFYRAAKAEEEPCNTQ